MKKFLSLVIIFLMCITLIPESILAEANKETELEIEILENESTREDTELAAETPAETVTEAEMSGKDTVEENNELTKEAVKDPEAEKQTSEKEYNEFGIEIGTMVHGEDISKLSEEELQYIPEGWRDGVIESEHPEEAQEKSMMSRAAVQSYPDVNNYIQSNKLSVARIEYDHKDFFTKFNYRYGFGKAEGVVAHETANSNSTITGEIAFMSKNHKNAFVHAFVDHNRIIEIHPPELGAWGGGRYANQRFVHVELVRVHNFADFAKSINNYADYLASLLNKFDLELIDADKHREGTLWSHRAVSNYLGGTTHVDPHGYFASWGYNWNDFVALVTKKYNVITSYKENSTSKLGHFRSANVEIYPNIKKQYSFSTAGSKYTNAVYYIKKEAVYNGTEYYLLSNNPSSTSGVVGWAKAGDISAYSHKGIDKKSKTFYLKGSGSTYSKAWGGSKDLVYKNMLNYTNKEFKVHLTETVGDTVWYRGTLNDKTVWIDSKHVSAAKEYPTSMLGHIRSTSVKIYPELGNNISSFAAGTSYTHLAYYIKKEANFKGSKYYLLSKNPSSVTGVIGWAKASDLSTHKHTGIDKTSKTFYLKGSGSAYGKAWGGSKDAIYQNLSKFKNHVFKVHLTESVGNNTWYRGELNGSTVWIHSNFLSTEEESKTSILGHLRSENVKIYPELGNVSTAVTAGTTYTNSVYYIKKKAIINSQLYYLLSKNPSSTSGVVGWAKASDLSTHDHKGLDKKAKTFYLKGTGNAFSKAWGGSQDEIYGNLANYKGKQFNVHLTETVGSNVWYRGTLNGKTVWIHNAFVK